MSKLMPIALILLLSGLVFGSLSAVEKKEEAKPTDFQITGEAPEGKGYKLFFNKDKSTYFHFWGYSRLYWYFDNSTNKLRMSYFRFHIDGQKDNKWQFHTRLDYSNSFSASKLDTTRGAYSIYFARAYVTYLLNDNITIDAGRILHQHNRYDVLDETAKYEVGHGIAPHLKFGDLSADLSLLYIADAQQMSSNGDNEGVYAGGRLGYEQILAKDVKLGFGLGYQGNYKDVGQRFHQFMPDISLNLPFDLYIVNQMMIQDLRDGEKNNNFQNYTEVGKQITEKLSVDLFLDTYKKQSSPTYKNSYYEAGSDVVYVFSPSASVVYNIRMSDIFDDIPNDNTNGNLAHKAYVEFMF